MHDHPNDIRHQSPGYVSSLDLSALIERRVVTNSVESAEQSVKAAAEQLKAAQVAAKEAEKRQAAAEKAAAKANKEREARAKVFNTEAQRIDAQQQLLSAQQSLMSAINGTHYGNPPIGGSTTFAKHRKALSALAAEFGYKIVLVGDNTRAMIAKL